MLLLIMTVGWGSAEAQDWLARAKALYASAQYEEALAALDRLSPTLPQSAALEALRSRALCWYALGQTVEGDRAIESLVDLDPLYQGDADELPPRVAQSLSAARRARLPVVARTALIEARRALQRQDLSEADRLLALSHQFLHDPLVRSDDALSDLRLAASALGDVYDRAATRPWAAAAGSAGDARPTPESTDSTDGQAPQPTPRAGSSSPRRPIFRGVEDR